MDDIDLRQLRYLVAVAEAGGVTPAAERLAMTQPALSRAIRALERSVGVPLLVRLPRGVRLTAAGEILVGEARGMADRMAGAVRRTRGAGAQLPRPRVTGRGCEVVTLQELTRSYNEAHPGTPVEAVVADWHVEQGDVLRAGGAELAIIRCPFDARGLDTEVLSAEPRVALVSANHRLAGRAVAARAEFTPDPVVVWATDDPAERAHWLGTDAGHHEVVAGPEVDDLIRMLALVRLGEAIAFVSAGIERVLALPAELRVVAVDGLPPVEVRLAWAEDETSPEVARFVRHALSLS